MKRQLITPQEISLDRLASAARAFAAGESGATLDALRFSAIEYVAMHVRSSNDNPDIPGGGSVASFLDWLAFKFRKQETLLDEVAELEKNR